MCIYKIYCAGNNKIYIGSAKSVYKRWQYHIQDLKRGNHKNNYLQHAWNYYGGDSFAFSVVEEIRKVSDLIPREQFWMDFYNSSDLAIGFNLCPTVASQLGHKWTEEQKKKQSERMKGRMSREEALRRRSKMANTRTNTKITETDVFDIVERYNKGEMPSEIASAYGLQSDTTIRNILRRKTWRNVTEGLKINIRKRTPKNTNNMNMDVIREVRSLFSKGKKTLDISKTLNIDHRVVKKICNNETWKE